MDWREAMRRMFPTDDGMPMRYANPGARDPMRWVGYLAIVGVLLLFVAVIALIL